jgi:transcriptional regulator with XRE-family HTH domain
METNLRISKNLKSFREKLNLTQEQTASFLGIARENISYYETGNREIPIEHLQKLSDLFGVELYDLMESDDLIDKVNLALAIRASTLSDTDIKRISEFKRIIKNYLKMLKIESRSIERINS